MNLKTYRILRRELKNEIGILIANGEMGGLARNDGLGFDTLWLTDFWRCEAERAPVGPFRFTCPTLQGECSAYRQELELEAAVVSTEARFQSEVEYGSQCFFSQSNRHLMGFRLENRSLKSQRWILSLPGAPERVDERTTRVKVDAMAAPMVLPFTSLAWVVRSSLPMGEWGVENAIAFVLEPGHSLELVSALVTSFDGLDFMEEACNTALAAAPFALLLKNHLRCWAALWERLDITLPEGPYAETFYRSLYYALSITGASQFLPGVCHFADPGWEMIPFTNDVAYMVALMASINHHERATEMLREFYKPDALQKNGRAYLNILEAISTQDDLNDAYSFAQMINISGTESNFIYGRQRHLDGLMPAIFRRVSSLRPDDQECAGMTYDVLKGCAIFWMRMLFWDEEKRGWLILKTLDLDEKTHGVSVMSAVIACRWTLTVFARSARTRETDADLAERCEFYLKNLYWPENAEHFSSFPDDPEEAVSSKYNCIRAFSTLGYPFCELIELYDMEKAKRTLDFTRKRNALDVVDAGVNAMTTNMYALTEASMGRSAEALQYASLALRRLDPSGIAMGEARTDGLFYCATSYCTFALTTIQMLLQSYDGIIRPFPALPAEWRDASFSKIPAEEGIQVSGEVRDGVVVRVIYEKNGCILLETNEATPVKIRIENGQIALDRVS